MEDFIKNLDLHAKGVWCPIIWTLILVSYVLIMRKKNLNWLQIYCTIGIISMLAWVSNSIFGVFLDWVDFGNPAATGFAEMLTYTFIPSSLAVIFLNKFKNENRLKRTILFVILSLFIEWTCNASGYMVYKHWSIFFSVPVYFVIYYIALPIHYYLIRQINSVEFKSKEE